MKCESENVGTLNQDRHFNMHYYHRLTHIREKRKRESDIVYEEKESKTYCTANFVTQTFGKERNSEKKKFAT